MYVVCHDGFVASLGDGRGCALALLGVSKLRDDVRGISYVVHDCTSRCILCLIHPVIGCGMSLN